MVIRECGTGGNGIAIFIAIYTFNKCENRIVIKKETAEEEDRHKEKVCESERERESDNNENCESDNNDFKRISKCIALQ